MGIGHTNSSQFGLASIPAARRPFHLPAKSKAAQRFNAGFVREGVADLARHPLNDPTPAGATIARVGVRFEAPGSMDPRSSGKGAGTATSPALLRSPAGGGEESRRHVPNSQA